MTYSWEDNQLASAYRTSQGAKRGDVWAGVSFFMSEAFKCRVCVGIARAEVFKRRQVRGVQLQIKNVIETKRWNTLQKMNIYMHVVMMIAFINLNSGLVCMYIYVCEHIELPAKLPDYLLRSNTSNINQCKRKHVNVYVCIHTYAYLYMYIPIYM